MIGWSAGRSGWHRQAGYADPLRRAAELTDAKNGASLPIREPSQNKFKVSA